MATGEGTVGTARNQLNALDLGQAKRIAAEIHFLEVPLEEKILLFSQLQSALAPEYRAELRGFLGRLRPVYLRPAQGGGTLPEPGGKDLLFHVRPFPGEPQMRAAYEVALEGFLDYLEGHGYPVVERGAGWVRLYQPPSRPFELGELWRGYLEKSFSRESLLRGMALFIQGLKSRGLRLSKRDGGQIGLPKVPIPSLDMALFFIAWCSAEGLVSEDSLGKLPKQHVGFIRHLSSLLKSGRNQKPLLRGEAKSRAEELIQKVLQGQLDPLPQDGLLLPFGEPLNLGLREAGDGSSKFCHACGRSLRRGEGSEAGRFVFAEPTGRLQSGKDSKKIGGKVCPLCAAIALAMPFKIHGDSCLVRIGDLEDLSTRQMAREIAHAFALGSLHIASGRYLLLNSPMVRAGGNFKPLSQVYGRLVYALQALGKTLNPEVIRRFRLYLLEGNQEIPLSRPALWLSHLLQEAFGAEPGERNDRGQEEVNRDLGEALRYALSNLPWHAIYVLTQRYGQWKHDWEKGLRTYTQLLIEEEDMVSLHERFKDVAGLTGLLYAWANYVERQVGRGEAKRAIAKLLDNLESASTFLYVAAYELDAQEARLYEGGGGFFYQEAKRLLQEAGGLPQEEVEEQGQRYLRVSQDDLHRVYAHLAEKYPDKQWKDFVYEVRLSLASRFPQYIKANE